MNNFRKSSTFLEFVTKNLKMESGISSISASTDDIQRRHVHIQHLRVDSRPSASSRPHLALPRRRTTSSVFVCYCCLCLCHVPAGDVPLRSSITGYGPLHQVSATACLHWFKPSSLLASASRCYGRPPYITSTGRCSCKGIRETGLKKSQGEQHMC